MKYIILFTIFFVISLASCKTSEANYRTAYEKAVALRDIEDIDDNQLAPRYVIENGDTIAVVVENVSVVKDSDIQPQVKSFGVVVGKFRQRFNAMSLRDRFVDAGYNSAIVVATASDEYYIIAVSYDTAKEAKVQADRLSAHPPVVLAKDMPFILHDPRWK